MLPDHYFHTNADGTRGRMKSLAERQSDEARAQLAEMSVRAQVAAETEKPAPSWQETYLAYAQERAEVAHRPDLKRQAKERLKIAERAMKQHEEQVAAETKQKLFDQHEATRRARDHAIAFERTPPQGADARQVALAVAFARSNDFDSPEALAKKYFEHVAAIEEQALHDQQRAADVAQTAAYKASMEASAAKVAALETQQRLNQAKEQL